MKILVTGPESSGKSTLARSLAWALDGYYVEEQARPYLNERDGRYERGDLLAILNLQLSAEDRAVATGSSYIFCDTGPEVVEIWSLVKYGEWMHDATGGRLHADYDLVLLCAPDLPWKPDRLREHASLAARLEIFALYRSRLPHAVLIRGKFRTEQAIAAVLACVPYTSGA